VKDDRNMGEETSMSAEEDKVKRALQLLPAWFTDRMMEDS
jgi:hypothetical protein